MNHNDELRLQRRLQHVPRWAIVPKIKQQTVAEHSYGVMSLVLWMFEEARGNGTSVSVDFEIETIKHAIKHDQYEAVTGDTPSTAKQQGAVALREPDTGPVPTWAIKLVHLADITEALLFCRDEIDMGNKTMQPVYEELYSRVMHEYQSNPWAAWLGLSFTEYVTTVTHVTRPSSHPGMLEVYYEKSKNT